ncbi:hypothetical protein LACDD01_00597 [Lactococcus sp. DD01]|jgi:hypothetical protein|nr:hypothetical protein LACDD01_00597 [Lactococcus sp. DD01]
MRGLGNPYRDFRLLSGALNEQQHIMTAKIKNDIFLIFD